MKLTNGKFGTTIASDREVSKNVPAFEAGVFPANKRFGFSLASPGNFGVIVVVFGRGFYFVFRGA